MRNFVASMRKNGEVLRQISDFNERMRRRCQHELNLSKSEIDSCNNHIFELKQNKQLYTTKYAVLEEQFTLLFNSIETISNAKNLEDKFDVQINLMQLNLEKQNQDLAVTRGFVRETTIERDQYRKHTNELLTEKSKLEKEKQTQFEVFKKRVFELDRDMKQKTEEANDHFENKCILEKEKKNLIAEREKMKDRIKKLKQKKGKMNIAQKVCKNCSKDYMETENFNWSCRVHKSEWSGEIWWCCGKDNKDQPGCKYLKHESKEEDEEMEDEEGTNDKTIKNIRCHCCKEIGHLIDSCPRDPNIRSNVDTEDDFMRIQKIKDYRKLNADTVVTTTHFLKKCILVPTRQSEQEERAYQEHPFKRGSMKFDDYNYQVYNPYILI